LGLVFNTKVTNGVPQLVAASPEEKVQEAVSKLEQYDLTQIPVIENNKSVGSLYEADVMSRLINNPSIMDKRVAEIMDKPLPVIDELEDIKKAIRELKKSPAVLVSEYGNIVGIVTRYDVLDFV
jgi:predicted transcriptional regulator